jgi:hypothetical protein
VQWKQQRSREVEVMQEQMRVEEAPEQGEVRVDSESELV